MNSNWTKCFQIIQKPERLIVGLMSGTSLDGLDIALCAVKGSGSETSIRLLEFKTAEYEDSFKSEVKSIFSRRDADLQLVCLMNEKIALLHASQVLDALRDWNVAPEEVDVIASHGQTIFHAPSSLHRLQGFPNGTLQIGDGDHIAVRTGIITISDFRQKHLAAGGEGAPLVAYGDYLLFSKLGEDRLMLNIGGIANFTYLPGDGDPSKVFSTDVGPGNTLMDQFVQHYFTGLHYDRDAEIAAAGKVNPNLLQALKETEFLKAGFPKTTGPELFNLAFLHAAMKRAGVRQAGSGELPQERPQEAATVDMAGLGADNSNILSREDVMSTLSRFSADVIVGAVNSCFGPMAAPVIYLSGGGMHNPLLVGQLKDGLPNAHFFTTAELGIHPDAKEAVLFALLANETLVGGAVDFGAGAGVPAVTMGKISFPY